MKKVLPRTLGFLLVTLFPIVYLHVVKLPIWAEVFDGILSSLVFAVPFAMGLSLGKPMEGLSEKQEISLGMLAAAFMWAVIWMFWSVVPESFRPFAETWAFPSHLAITFITGLWTTVIWKGQPAGGWQEL